MNSDHITYFNWSDHAIRRAQQRGVSTETVTLIAAIADRRTRVPGGVHAISVSDKAASMLINGGITPAAVERVRNVVLIADLNTHTLITIEHGHGRNRRFRR